FIEAIEKHDQSAMEEELGDLLFVLTNIARHYNIDAEIAIVEANNKFIRRFKSIEQQVQGENKPMEDISLEEMDSMWEIAKQKEEELMRIDKYLKTARIIKRRPLAKEIAEQGRIKVNGTVVKPSVDVQPGDEMEIRFARTVLTIKILQVKDHVKKDDVSGLYEIIREEKTDQEQ